MAMAYMTPFQIIQIRKRGRKITRITSEETKREIRGDVPKGEEAETMIMYMYIHAANTKMKLMNLLRGLKGSEVQFRATIETTTAILL